MNRTISWNSNFIVFGIPLLIILSSVFLAQSELYLAQPRELSWGITLDLILTAPLVYLLLIRKKKIPKTTAAPVFVLGIVIASLVLPKDQQFLLSEVKQWVLPLVEMTVFFLVVYKVRKAIEEYKIQKSSTPDFFSALKKASAEVLPAKASTVFATEIAVVYYSFFSWKKRKLASNEFSYHKESGTPAILGAFLFIVLIEAFAMHLLLERWNGIVAWVLTILSLYSGLQLLGIVRSLSKRPIVVEENSLQLRYGIMSETTIQFENIVSVELFTKELEEDSEIKKLTPLGGLEGHNVLIRLKEKETLSGFYGLKKEYDALAFHVDDKVGFVERLESNK